MQVSGTHVQLCYNPPKHFPARRATVMTNINKQFHLSHMSPVISAILIHQDHGRHGDTQTTQEWERTDDKRRHGGVPAHILFPLGRLYRSVYFYVLQLSCRLASSHRSHTLLVFFTSARKADYKTQ